MSVFTSNSPHSPEKMFFLTLTSLSLIANAWCSVQTVIIQNDSGDPETHLQPIYSPLSKWETGTVSPSNGDNNPANITGPVTLSTTLFASPIAETSMTLLFPGACDPNSRNSLDLIASFRYHNTGHVRTHKWINGYQF